MTSAPDVTWTRADGSSVPGYSCGADDATAGLIVIQEWWGVTPQILAQSKQLSEYGYKCLVPDLYRGKLGVDAEEAGHLMNNLDWAMAVEDLKGAAKYLKETLGMKKVGVVGFCMGGALSLASGTLFCDLVDCVVAFYGTPAAELCNVENMSCPAMGHFGEDDGLKGFSDKERVAKLKEELAKSGKEYVVHSYPGVGHAFMNDMPEMREKVKDLGFGDYKSDVAVLAWDRTKEFFAKYLQ
mmetsp:Transcript_58622/g.69934  ORF Transcript_58622/g.69934 Transcript_58622/m.69934 type:complete len:240 (+) Transcript_58622:156-875(+)|eukprot:CAMPEP_0172484836 /NCGR_PEP_ID=MMETSP1066-20121228/12471_1 /TAXON_ID=671091 /ORGANISM="Coscinodiscus wailesii, Strain CCMP2513" /LENGTH=239 /DNA_ID=CAMNT_0013249615 /DNA_START=129 /DNA_END=848 /DNA_ORIENTATION=-